MNAHMMAYRQDSRQEHLTQMGSVASYLVRHGDDRVKALGLQGLSAYYYYSSDYNNAETSAESAVDLITKMGGGDSKSWEVAKNNLAMAKRAQGDTQGSVKEFEDIVNTRGTNMGVVTAMNAASTFNSYGVEKYVQLAIILSEHAMKKAQEEMLSPKTKKSLEGLYSQLHEGQKKDAPEGGGTNTTEDPTIEAESGLENVAVTDDKIRRETGDSPEAAAEAAPTQAEGTADGAEVKDVAPAPPNTDVQPHPKVESQPGGTVITPPKEETAQTNTGEVTSRPEDAPTTAAPAVVEKLEPIKFYSSLAEVELKPEDYAKRGGNDMATRIDVQFEVRWMDDDMGHAISQRDIRLKRTCMRLIKGASLDDLLRINKAITELREIMKPPEGEDVQSTEGQQAKASRSALALAAFRSFIYGSTQGDTHAADAASAAPVETQDEKLTTSDLNALLNGELPYKKQGTVAGAIHKLGWRGDKRITDDANALVKGNLTVESAGELHELLDRMMIAMVGVMSIRQTAWHNEFEDAANRILNKFSQNPEAAQTTKDEIDQKRTMIAEIARRTHLEEEQLVVDRVNPGENPSMEKLAIELIRAQE